MAKSSSKTSAKSLKLVASNPVAAALQPVLRDSYVLYLLTHNYHWNVEGPQFLSLHTLFEQQYTELFTAIDAIAERIRALDAYALPDEYGDILQAVSKLTNPMAKEKSKSAVAERMIANLITLHERVVASAQKAKEVADDLDDEESEDIAIGRIGVHQKALWMLKSLLK